MVNRELTRRVKYGQEVAWSSRAIHSDLHVILDLVKAVDKKADLWEHTDESEEKKVCHFKEKKDGVFVLNYTCVYSMTPYTI